MFGRNRREERSVSAIREELSTADMHARAVLTDAISQIELRLGRDREERERSQMSMETAIQSSRSAVSAQAMDVARVLEQVSNTCALVVEQVEADRAERRALTEALASLTRQLQLPAPSPAGNEAHPLGGTVFAAPVIDRNGALVEPHEDTIDLVEVDDTVDTAEADDTIDLGDADEAHDAPEVDDAPEVPKADDAVAVDDAIDIEQPTAVASDDVAAPEAAPAEDESPGTGRWVSKFAADDTIDLRERKEPSFTPRRFPRWPVKKPY